MKKSTPFLMPLFRSALFIAVGLLFAVLTKQSLQQASRWWTVLCVLCNIITILVLMAICKRDGITYKQLIGYKKNQCKIKYILFIIVIMLLTGIGGMYGAGFMIYGHIPVIMVQPVPIWIAAVNVILLPLTIVFAELPLYFGYSINGIEKATGNKIFAIVYAMFFYALQHSFIPLLWDFKYMLFRFLSFLPLLLILGIIYNKNRKLQPLMIGHGVMDLATGTQILILSIYPAFYEMMQKMS